MYESKGEIYFNELNLRFGAFGYSIICAGANLPNLFVKKCFNEPIDFDAISVEEKTVCLSEKVNYDDFLAGYYDKKEYDRISHLADSFFIKDEKDIKPYLVFKYHMFKRLVKRWLK